MTPEEIAAAEKAKADEAAKLAADAEAAKIAAEAKTKADAEAAKKAAEEEVFDKDRAMATIHNLREIEKQAKKDAKRLAELEAEDKKRADAALSETERLTKQAAEAKAEAAKLKADIMRRDVITEKGLSPILADRLKGDTKEEMLADADALLKALPSAKVTPKVGPTNPANGDAGETEQQKRERLFGRQGQNPFDRKAIEEAGGGVVWNGGAKK